MQAPVSSSPISVLTQPLPDTYTLLGEALGNVDELRFLDSLMRTVGEGPDVTTPAGCNFLVRGWALNPDPPRLANRLVAEIDRSIVRELPYGRERADIGAHFGNPSLGRSGFKSLYSLVDLSLGEHELRVLAVDDERSGYYLLSREFPFAVAESRSLFPGTSTVSGRIQWAIEHVETVSGQGKFDGMTIDAKAGDIIVIRGWALDRTTSSPSGTVFAVVDHGEYVLGIHRLPSPEIRETLGVPNAHRCRFTVRIPTRRLVPGTHRVELAILASAGTEYETVPVARLALK